MSNAACLECLAPATAGVGVLASPAPSGPIPDRLAVQQRIHRPRRLLANRLCRTTAFAALAAITACSTEKPGLYVGGILQPEGPTTLRQPLYAYRFVEKWRISHVWLQGTGIGPCRYGGNVFRRLPGYPKLAGEAQAPLFEKDGRIYAGTSFEPHLSKIVFVERKSQIIGDKANNAYGEEYTPFCEQWFPASWNGMGLSIVKPDAAKGTDEWIRDATPTMVNGLTWWVRRMPSRDLSVTGEAAKPIEFWTLKIPDTPYWMHLRFTGSLNHSIQKYPEEHRRLLALFHRIIDSVTLEPITPVAPEEMPPFVLWQPKPYVPTGDRK